MYGQRTALLGASPIDLDQIAFIQPMGLMIGGHVTPIDHGIKKQNNISKKKKKKKT